MTVYTACFHFCRPEHLRSGLFVFLVLLISNASAQLPSSTVPDVFDHLPDLLARASHAPGIDTNSITRIYGSAAYNDLYRKTVTATDGSKSLLDKTSLYSTFGDAGVVLDRLWWGAEAHAGAGKIDGSWREHDNDYILKSEAQLHSLEGAGWMENRWGRLLFGLGYVPGLPYDRNRKNAGSIINKAFADPRLFHFVSGTACYHHSYLLLYKTKQPLINARTRIENQSNLAEVEIPLAVSKQESGFELGVEHDSNKLGFRVSANAISSDSAFSGKSILPAGLAGKGSCNGVFIDLPFLSFKPKGECYRYRYHLNIHGYDYSDTNRYFYLDGNDLVFTQGRLSVRALWNFNAGVFGEYGSCTSNKIGRLDPYVFSSFSIFDPTKYRIDTAWAEFQAAGLFLERLFTLFNRDILKACFSMAYVTFEGSLRTRDIVFIAGFIPDLVNPRSFDQSLYEMILLTPEITYTYKSKFLAWNIGLKQLIPIELSHSRNTINSQSPVTSNQKLWGGTTVKTGIEYCLHKSHW